MQTIGRYSIVDEIGRGGMGRVFRAQHRQLGRDVAVKTILINRRSGDQQGQAAGRERLRIEARVAASLDHRNIVTVYDYEGDGEVSYTVMELIDGLNLKEIAAGCTCPVAKGEVVHIIGQSAAALDHAHVFHRDIKPPNVMVRRDGVVKLMDLGIAKTRKVTGLTLSAPAKLAGNS